MHLAGLSSSKASRSPAAWGTGAREPQSSLCEFPLSEWGSSAEDQPNPPEPIVVSEKYCFRMGPGSRQPEVELAQPSRVNLPGRG